MDRARSREREAEIEAELYGPGVPSHAAYLWEWFDELRGRCGNDLGPGRITWEAADAWARLMRISPAPWEILLIMDLDDAWRAARAGRPLSADDD